MPSDLPKLYPPRHGDTAWTDSHQHTGRTDLPLNERGGAACPAAGCVASRTKIMREPPDQQPIIVARVGLIDVTSTEA
jgi:hypothetical protein